MFKTKTIINHYLYSQLGYSEGAFQALQPILIVVCGASCMLVHFL